MVTLSLMILLTILAVGLLTLSSVSLRSSGQANAMATARANARLALMLALGELQQSAGPDKAVTATSEVLATTPGKPNITGVWSSWDFDPTSSSLNYTPGKSDKFARWLVSYPDPAAVAKDTAFGTTPWPGATIELVGDKSLGGTAPAAAKARAGRVPISRDNKLQGAFAWHVADESVKARINTYRDVSGVQTLSQKRSLLAGHRPDPAVMKAADGSLLSVLPNDLTAAAFTEAQATAGKTTDLAQVELYGTAKGLIKPFRNDITPYSLGLLTNVREGGLKQDLTSVFEMTTTTNSGTTGLPAAFTASGSTSKKLYQTNVYSSGSAVTGVSDPYWSALAGYYNSYKDLLTPETSPTFYKAPPENIVLANPLAQSAQFSPAPVIAKVELMFSLVVRDKHGPWKGRTGDYELHFLYIPVVTLHNPYNVSLKFDRMKIGFVDPPVAFTFFVNGAARNNLTPLRNLFSTPPAAGKAFWIELADWSSAAATSPTGPTTMRPGQTMIYGPYINATEKFGDDHASYFDYANNKTGTEAAPLKAKRGFTGGTYGYNLDWLVGSLLNVNSTDLVAVEFKTIAPPGVTSFKVNATITANGVTQAYGGLNFTYGSQAALDKVLPDLLRYPKTGGIVAEAMHLGNEENPAGSLKAQSFALFSAYARTANGGVDGAALRTRTAGVFTALPDGRLSGNPFLHHNPARVVVASDFTTEKPATQSHELNLLKLDGSADDVISFASDFRTNYLVNYKQVNARSIKSGSYLEIPSGPLQAIADFRRSNALASPYLPAFVQPVGNSYASPLIGTNTVLQTGAAAYTLMDHSVLANHALYDGSYFSTFAPVGGKSAVDGFTEFMKDNQPLRSQLFQAYLPAGKTVAAAQSELFASNGKPTASAYKIAAQYQMVKGPFNVNSTRVQAWKAVLASMNRSQMNILWAKTAALAAPPIASGGIPLPAMTLHNGCATTGAFDVTNIDDLAANQWNGYREFTDADIEKLATEIVKQVQARGPFLSMSEFVNRQIGSDSKLSRTGALQNAIDDSLLNDSAMGTQVAVKAEDVADKDLYGFKTPLAATGNPAAGAPGWLSQADILKILEPAATVRSDTFVIRTCGEATDNNGTVLAKAYAEAVVQRVPEYVNPSDPAAAKVPNPNAPGGTVDPATPLLTAPENLAYGRRFIITSFKWLTSNEI